MITTKPNLKLVTKPLCTTCHKRAAEMDGECEPCRTLGIAQNYAAQSYEDIQELMDALDCAAMELEQAAQRTRSTRIKSDLQSAASNARRTAIKMWERYGLS